MPQDPRAALSALLRATDIEDHDEVLKAANAAIKADKNDDTAKHTKAVALLKLDRFDDALRFIAGEGSKLQDTCVLENAYALYKTGKLDEATEVLKSAGLERRSLRHVAAQVAYRAERFDEAEAIYRQLLDNDATNENSDLKINSTAAVAQSEWQGLASSVPLLNQTASLDAFEVCYNVACTEIARGNLELAANLLQRASMLCDNSDELDDEEKQAELRPIRAQQAYVYAKSGKLTEALEIYQSLGPATDNDGPDFAVITQNNLLALEPSENPYLRLRKYFLPSTGSKSKLFSHQTNILKHNGLIIDLGAHKVRGVSNRTEKILSQAKHPSIKPEITSASALNSAAETHGSTGKEALRKLQALAIKRPNDVGLILTIIQIQLQQQQGGAALSVLESFLNRLDSSSDVEDRDARFSPGLIALAVSLMRAQQRESSAKVEIVKAARYWQDRPSGSVSSLLVEAGIELMRSSNADHLSLAGSAFEKLFEQQQGSDIVSAGLVASFAASDTPKVQQHVSQLPPVDDLIGGIDIDELFAAGVAVVPSSVASRKRPAAEETSEKATKKRRRRKLPKNYVEGKTPDPERWLPLRDRSSYRPKGKKGKKRAGEATQGGIVKEEETLELVGGGGVKVEKTTATSSKKKKKGKK